jgi:hypothetical protein
MKKGMRGLSRVRIGGGLNGIGDDEEVRCLHAIGPMDISLRVRIGLAAAELR